MSKRGPNPVGVVITVVGLLLVCAAIIFGNQFWYAMARVDEKQLGVQFESGRIINVVGPGVYGDTGLYVDLLTVDLTQIPFSVVDPEVVTADKQRIGVTVAGDVFRTNDKEFIRNNWTQYNLMFTDNDAVAARMSVFSGQSMKVCVGDRDFNDAVIGTARDALRACIEDELNKLSAKVGLTVDNVTVPEVIISPAVQQSLDAIVEQRLAQERAKQTELTVAAQARAEQARQEGEIRIAQSRIQEEAKQQAALAQLDAAKKRAQIDLVTAEGELIRERKANELIEVERDLEIAKISIEVEKAYAEADMSLERVRVDLYSRNPKYLDYLGIQANAMAMRGIEKIMILPDGTMPNIVLPGPSITTLPVVPASN